MRGVTSQSSTNLRRQINHPIIQQLFIQHLLGVSLCTGSWDVTVNEINTPYPHGAYILAVETDYTENDFFMILYVLGRSRAGCFEWVTM